jgi:hypothetical protein
LCAPETTLPAAAAISTVVVSLLFRLLSGPTEPVVPFQNLHQSLPDHLWPSFPLTFAENLTVRRHRGCLAVGYHRAVPRPSLRHQSTPSGSNRTPCSLVCLLGPHLTAGKCATAVGVRLGKAEGSSVNL